MYSRAACSKCPTPINSFRPVSFQVQLNLQLAIHHLQITQLISIRIRLSLYSQVSVFQDTTQCNSQSIFIFPENDSGHFLLYKKELLSHRNQSEVLFQLTFILRSMIQVMLMNVNASFVTLSTIVLRLNPIKVLRSYLKAHLDLQAMYNVVYLGMFRFYFCNLLRYLLHVYIFKMFILFKIR